MMNLILHQAVALSQGKKRVAEDSLTAANKLALKPELFGGHSRRYTPLDAEEPGAQLPDDDKRVQLSVNGLIRRFDDVFKNHLDLIATNEVGNTEAKADVVINETAVLKDVPVSCLLAFEKKAKDLLTFVSNLPVLNAAETWSFDENSMIFKSQSSRSFKMQKVLQNHVLHEATDKHPAQVETYHKDVPVGTWETIQHSGAISRSVKEILVKRAQMMHDALVAAREEANTHSIAQSNLGSQMFNWIFQPLTLNSSD